MRLPFLIVVLTAVIVQCADAQSPRLAWAHTTDQIVPTALVSDSAGNVYMTGSFSGIIDLDPGPGILLDTARPGAADGFMVKLDSSGAFLWGRAWGGDAQVHPRAIARDSTGLIAVVGDFDGTADMNPGRGVISASSSGGADGFIIKFRGDGSAERSGTWATSGREHFEGIAIDRAGYHYIFGRINSNPYTGIFLLRLQPNALSDWIKVWGNESEDRICGIAVDSMGVSYIAGTFRGRRDMDPDSSSLFLESAGESDVFAMKVGVTGHLLWAERFGGTTHDVATDIALDAPRHRISIIGQYERPVVIPPRTDTLGTVQAASNDDDDLFLTTLATDGTLIRDLRFGGEERENRARISIDALGNSYVTAQFGSSTYIASDGVEQTITGAGLRDVLMMKLDTGGVLVWGAALGGTSVDSTNASAALSLSPHCLYLHASYANDGDTGTIDVDPGVGQHRLPPGNILQKFALDSLHLAGTGSVTLAGSLSIFPNPTSGPVTVQSPDSRRGMRVYVHDLRGNTVFASGLCHDQSITIDLSQLPAGIYFLDVISDGGVRHTYLYRE